MAEEKIAKTFKKQLFWVSFVSIIIIFFMGLYINNLNNALDNCYNRQNEFRENSDYKCGEGLKRECINENKRAIEIGEDETYVICDTDRKERAVCVDEDASWTQCEQDEFAYCMDNDVSWRSCNLGENARCLKDGRSATVSDTGRVTECPIGENPTCVNWNTESICSN